MITFLARRVLSSIVALAGVMVIVFFLARLTGSPANLYLPEEASEEAIRQFNENYGLNDPIWVQFARFVGDTLRLDFGDSIRQQRPAIEAVLAVFPHTLSLALVAMICAIVISVVLGCLAAFYSFKLVDRLITVSSLTTASIPDFWFALVGILFFAVQLGVLPTSGTGSAASWILPVATLILAPVGVLTQVVRGAMIDAMNSGYIQNARARGFGQNRLLFRHGLRNAALPIITVAGDRAVGMINGAIIVDTVFAWPGVGGLIVRSVLDRDFAVIQAGVFVIGVAVILFNILIDLTYALVDPRVRVS
ncbi:MAG TPA: ABC transporter permease [Pseudolysinimonas sp.]|nr:ABC transporter permease [Pseudolysinimonas sp.]